MINQETFFKSNFRTMLRSLPYLFNKCWIKFSMINYFYNI